VSTLLTLIVIPTVYAVVDRKRYVPASKAED
jgi:Cu/Ag efflux pump CusA